MLTKAARSENLARAERAALVMADDLCYEYGVMTALRLSRHAAAFQRALSADVHPNPAAVKAIIKSTMRTAEQLDAWFNNYERGEVYDHPDREVLECKD